MPGIPQLLLLATTTVLAPLGAELPLRVRLPIVVVEGAPGIVVGPHGLHLIAAEGVVGFLGQLGLALLFFLAGLELAFDLIRGRRLTLAIAGWFLRPRADPVPCSRSPCGT